MTANQTRRNTAGIVAHWTQQIRVRMLGENVTFTRAQWDDLLDDLNPDSSLAKRIRERLEQES